MRGGLMLVAATAVLAVLAGPLSAQLQAPATGPGSAPAGDVAFAPTTDMIENGGLGVRVLFLGRNPDGKRLTVSAELKNMSDTPLYLGLVGPAPAAIDNFGVTYALKQVAGLATCYSLDNAHIRSCFTNSSSYLPGASFSMLQPAASSIVALTFEAPEVTQSGFLSLSMSVAVAAGERPSDASSRASALENVPISFPVIVLAE